MTKRTAQIEHLPTGLILTIQTFKTPDLSGIQMVTLIVEEIEVVFNDNWLFGYGTFFCTIFVDGHHCFSFASPHYIDSANFEEKEAFFEVRRFCGVRR